MKTAVSPENMITTNTGKEKTYMSKMSELDAALTMVLLLPPFGRTALKYHPLMDARII